MTGVLGFRDVLAMKRAGIRLPSALTRDQLIELNNEAVDHLCHLKRLMGEREQLCLLKNEGRR